MIRFFQHFNQATEEMYIIVHSTEGLPIRRIETNEIITDGYVMELMSLNYHYEEIGNNTLNNNNDKPTVGLLDLVGCNSSYLKIQFKKLDNSINFIVIPLEDIENKLPLNLNLLVWALPHFPEYITYDGNKMFLEYKPSYEEMLEDIRSNLGNSFPLLLKQKTITDDNQIVYV